MKTIDVNEAIRLAREETSLDGLAIEDLKTTQIAAKDALLLARNGILIPEQNILYRDEDVKYDPEFDDYEWTQLPKGISIDELSKISDEYEKSQRSTLNVELEIEDEQLMNWAKDNYPTIKNMFTTILNGLYSSRSVIDKVD